MNYVAALNALSELLTLVPQGVGLWLRLKTAQAELAAMAAKGADYVPTPEEWDALDAKVATLEASIDDNAARAAQTP